MPILKSRVRDGCPEPAQGNKDLSNYMVRMKDILQQLETSREKGTAIQRLDNLKDEMIAKYPDLIVI